MAPINRRLQSPLSPKRQLSSIVILTIFAAYHVQHAFCSGSLLLPKRLVAQIGSKINLQLSDNEIENAFSLGRDMVVKNSQLEDDLVREGLFLNLNNKTTLNGLILILVENCSFKSNIFILSQVNR